MQHDFILLDRSGSMAQIWNEALGSVNSYVKKLADSNVDTGVTLAVFSDDNRTMKFDIVRDKIIPSTWKEVSDKEIYPSGGTPLNDATGKIVDLAMAGNYDKVAIIIMTDGEENASKELTVQQAKDLLDKCRARNWQVIFLGANFDNARQAQGYGASAMASASIPKGKFAGATQEVANSRVRYAATGQSMDFTPEAKARLEHKDQP